MRLAHRGLFTAILLIGLLVLGGTWVVADTRFGTSAPAYVEAVVGQPSRINPLAARDSDAEGDIAALVFSGLIRIGADGTPELELAESWEVTPDGLTHTFRLRPSLTWHDGQPLTAHDVAFTIERIQSPDFTGSAGLAAEWSEVQVFVADDRTVLIHTPEPAADFLARAAVGLVPRHRAEEMMPGRGFDGAPFDRAPVGAGPYRLVSLDGDGAVLERNTSYWDGAPPIERIEFRFAQDADEQLELLASGEVDAALLGEYATDEEREALETRPDVTTTLLPRNAFTILYLNTLREPLTDAALRRAIAASIDPAGIIEATDEERLEPGDGVIVPRSWAYVAYEGEPPDVDELWELSAWERGTDGMREREGERLRLELVTNNHPQREALAAAIAEQLRAQGVEVEVTPLPAATIIPEHVRPGRYELALLGWEAAVDPDPYPGWHTSQVSGTGGNVAGFQDAEADALLEAARTTMDIAERRELYAFFAGRFAEQAPSVVIGYPSRLYVHPARLDGLDGGLLFSPASRFRGVHRWELR